MKIKDNIEEFVHGLQIISPKEMKALSIELPIELCFQLEREIMEDNPPYNFIKTLQINFPIIFNFYGTKVKVFSKESREAVIRNKFNEAFKILTE